MLISHKAEKVKQIERRSVFSGPLPVKQVFLLWTKIQNIQLALNVA